MITVGYATVVGLSCAFSCIVGIVFGYSVCQHILKARKSAIRTQTEWFNHGGLHGPR